MSKLGLLSHFLSPLSCDSLVLQGLRCEWGAGVLNLLLSFSLSLILVHDTSWNSEDLKKNIVALHKDGVGYKKIVKTLKLSCSMWPRLYSGLTGQVPLRTGLAMVDQRSWVHVLSVISRGCVWEIDMSAASIAAEVEGVGGSACQCSDHTPHTASNWSA